MSSGSFSIAIIRKLRTVGTALFVLFAVAVSVTPAAATATPGSLKCTVKGTKGPDHLVGTKGPDVICGFGGKDVIAGRGGNDNLTGGKGKDTVRGGAGYDRLLGGKGDDKLFGGTGNDLLYGQPQDDSLYGGSGYDYLDGGAGTDELHGGTGQSFEGPKPDLCPDDAPATCDETGPELTALTISPTTIDTWEEARTVNINFTLKDDKSGIAEQTGIPGKPFILLLGKSASSLQQVPGGALRVSGDEHEASYEGSLKIPRYAAHGHWNIQINISDKAGNGGPIGPDELTKLGFPTGFDQIGQGDSASPKITELSFSASNVDTSQSQKLVHVRARVTDDTGVGQELNDSSYVVTGARKDQESQRSDGGLLQRTSGDKLDGIWEGDIIMQKYSAPGTWRIQFDATDVAGNRTTLMDDGLTRLGFQSTIQQTGAGDTTAPVVSEISVSPTRIDTTDGPQTVHLHFRMVDDLVGKSTTLDSVSLFLNDMQSPFRFDIARTSGNAWNGIWEGTVEVPQGASLGDYLLMISAYDDLGNGRYYMDDGYQAAGPGGSFHNGP